MLVVTEEYSVLVEEVEEDTEVGVVMPQRKEVKMVIVH
jgi:hypothetical protein